MSSLACSMLIFSNSV